VGVRTFRGKITVSYIPSLPSESSSGSSIGLALGLMLIGLSSPTGCGESLQSIMKKVGTTLKQYPGAGVEGAAWRLR